MPSLAGTAAPALAPACASPARVAARSHAHQPRVGPTAVQVGEVLAAGVEIHVPAGGWLRLVRRGATWRVSGGTLEVECTATRLLAGRLSLRAPRARPARALLDVPGASFTAERPRTQAVVAVGHHTRIHLRSGAADVASVAAPGAPLRALAGDVVITGPAGLPRLDTWPFGRSPTQRGARPEDRLPAFWADGLPCSVGCRAHGARAGWPLRPFHRQHPLRAGLNERRAANMHVGVDIQARDGQRVYAVQSGIARVSGVGTVDERVQIGAFLYWHVHHRVRDGQFVRAYRTVVGHVLETAGHLHLSEVAGGRFLNPLRAGGRVLAPWVDTEAPVIGAPLRRSGGRVDVRVFDPQSFRAEIRYRTPVLAPAALAYRARDARGRDLSGLRFALRGSQHLPDAARFVIYAADARSPGWTCFRVRIVCRPNWDYRLAGGLAPALPPGSRLLSIYAWDWAGNVAVRDVALH